MNRVTIEPTKFVNVRTGHATFGVRVYDDEGQSYDNTWDSIPEDDLEVLKLVLASDNQTITMMDFVPSMSGASPSAGPSTVGARSSTCFPDFLAIQETA